MRPQTDIERDLARLADGTLPADRARALKARVAESPELRAMLDEQRSALDAVRALTDPAPAALRARVENARRRPAPAARARRFGLAGAFAAGLAALVVALVAILPSGAGGPTLSEAAALSVKPSVAAAPRHDFDGALSLNIDGVPYPYWEDSLGWNATGMRTDTISGRPATTVFYEKGSKRVGYTIVSGKPVSVPSGATVTVRHGLPFRTLGVGGRTVVTWERKDHSCVLSGAGVSRAELLRLASWGDAGALPYSGSGSAA
jgi:anti-sigma factor RsiW